MWLGSRRVLHRMCNSSCSTRAMQLVPTRGMHSSSLRVLANHSVDSRPAAATLQRSWSHTDPEQLLTQWSLVDRPIMVHSHSAPSLALSCWRLTPIVDEATPLQHSDGRPPATATASMHLDSTKKKRRKKMNKHKLKKRRRRDRYKAT